MKEKVFVRLVEVYCYTEYLDYDSSNQRKYSHNFGTEWEEITLDEFYDLCAWCKLYNEKVSDDSGVPYYAIVKLVEDKPKPKIADYLDRMKREKEKRNEQDKKRQEDLEKAKAARAQKDREKKLEQLKKLQEELNT